MTPSAISAGELALALGQPEDVALGVLEPGDHVALLVGQDTVDRLALGPEVVVLEDHASFLEPFDLRADALEPPDGDRVLRGTGVLGLVHAEAGPAGLVVDDDVLELLRRLEPELVGIPRLGPCQVGGGDHRRHGAGRRRAWVLQHPTMLPSASLNHAFAFPSGVSMIPSTVLNSPK